MFTFEAQSQNHAVQRSASQMMACHRILRRALRMHVCCITLIVTVLISRGPAQAVLLLNQYQSGITCQTRGKQKIVYGLFCFPRVSLISIAPMQIAPGNDNVCMSPCRGIEDRSLWSVDSTVKKGSCALLRSIDYSYQVLGNIKRRKAGPHPLYTASFFPFTVSALPSLLATDSFVAIES